MDCCCGCGRISAPGGRLAWACYKQRKRTGSTVRKKPAHGARYPTRKARQLEAALDVAEALDLRRALDRMRKALRRKKDTVQKRPKTPR